MNPINIPYIQQLPEENVAPQYVQMRTTNKSVIYLDSRSQYNTGSNIVENSFNNIVFSTVKGPGQASDTLVKNCKRITTTKSILNVRLQNVNSFNNTLYLRYNGADYTVTMTNGAYPDPVLLIQEFLRALQAATGQLWIEQVAYTPATGLSTIRCNTALPFTFYNDDGSLNKIQYLLNIPRNHPEVTLMQIGPIFGYYTRYIDVNSNSLTRYAKTKAISNNNNNSNQLVRLYLDYSTTHVQITSNHGNSVMNWNRDDFLTQIDINLTDEYGNLLIIENDPNGPINGYYLLELMLEI